MFKVAIITVNFNGKKDTLGFLVSLSKLRTTNYELRTIMVDNGSTDGSVSAIRTLYPEVDILQNGTNKGFAGGYNRGLDYAALWGADYFLIINNDTLIKDSNLLEELIKTAQSDPNIGLVSPKIYFAPGFEFHKDKYSEGDLGKVIWYAGGSFDWNNIGSVHRGIDQVDKGKYAKVSQTGLISGACMLIKKQVLGKVSPFDENLFLYFEDSDFQIRVREAGFKTYYNGKVSIYHKVSRSTGIGSPITDYYHTRNRLFFGMKYGKIRTKFALLREAFRLILFGRPAQRSGVLDFYLGVKGAKFKDGNGKYPLKLSIGIVNYNTADLAKKLLESIFEKDSGFDENSMEVIVLDNGSSDNLKKIIKEFLPKVKYLENKVNEGFSKGYNKTIRFSKGEYYLMLNSDIEVLKGGLTQLIKAEDEFGGDAVLGGKLIFPDGSDQDSSFHLPNIAGALQEYFLKKKGSYFLYLPKGENPINVEGLVMACLLIPQKVINQVGLLDEGTFIFFEDVEYCRRLKKFGVPIYFIPSAKFIHHHGGATKRIGAEKAYALLKAGARHYHGEAYYLFLSWVLKFGQKLARVKTPVSRWTT